MAKLLTGISRQRPHGLLALALLALPVWRAAAEIQRPPKADACVEWAAGDVAAALQSVGVQPGAADINVVIVAKPGLGEQSFSIDLARTAVTLRAGGSLGAMYGLEELAEQIRNGGKRATWAQVARRLTPTIQQPFVEIRADNAFIHVNPLLLNDLDMWRAYLDMLARNRFNMLDLHGGFDLRSTGFPNLYPLLIHVPEYPNVGNEQEQTKNLASFKTIIAYAKSRGIRVAFMNYSANDGLGGAEKNAPSVTGVPPEKLADYTAKAVTQLIRELPELYLLGFRVGESGQPAAFYKDAYIKGVEDANRGDLRLYTRSWQTTKEQLVPLAQAARAGFDIEIKFNGEHLGLPYHALQTRYGSYSYEAYLDVPANYQILWQVRANGTHRFWAWEDTRFIRRTVRTFTLGNARGFTLEPQIAYFSAYPAAYYRSAGDRDVFKYMWQKYWMWYLAWGRLSYNPDLPEETIVRAYEQHFGKAGGKIYAAMQQGSAVVPLVYAYRFPGPDHRDFSPETETGNLAGKSRAKMPVLLQFIDNHPEDERTFAGIGAFVDAKLAHRVDGRVGPIAVAAKLSGAAKNVRAVTASVPALTGKAADEWRLLKTDLLSASWLGDYYASRITGLARLHYALKTGQETERDAAEKDLAASRESWRKLGETADAVYGPLSNPLRRQTNYQWSAQLEAIEKIDATVPQLWAAHATNRNAAPLTFTAADRGGDAGIHVESLQHTIAASKDQATISCRASARKGIAKLVLWFKPLPSQLRWQSADMTQLPDGSFSGTTALTPEGLMYAVEVQDRTGQAKNFPPVFEETPYHIIPAFDGKHQGEVPGSP